MTPTTPPLDDGEAPGFGREDRAGLGIAIAAHGAVLAGLLLFAKDPPPVPVDIPEPITVTVSEEIALESVSPDPAANPAPSVAEQLGDPTPPAPSVAEPVPAPLPPRIEQPAPQPQPRPEPRPQPRPEPRPQPRAEPKPQPKAEPRPQPKPAPRAPAREAPRDPAPARGSRLGSDFLAGTGGSGQDRQQPAQKAGPLTASALSSAISRQLRPHWSAPQGVDAEKLVTVLSWEMNRDGSVRGRPRVVSQSGVTDANEAQKDRHAELAIRAVQLAAPFDLPDEYYDTWKRVDSFRFDRRL
ncbi:hypothetical protein [uncultured Croceicoccus sp.]|uniref:hypothetical protein n=1 Tax=uncultured Croceicoccus sp. TaxID=1295329 RepID=UPI0026183330|nr:hypothetical protein [uncultured Croceicoccus sp.]